jgi:hypothetical protein
MALTAERLRNVVAYNQDTGEFTWVEPSGRRVKSGDRAGAFNRSIGYRVIGIDGVRYYEHRLAWMWMTGGWPSRDIDHMNCDKSDNRWTNLREATMAQNIANIASWRHNTSGLKGAHWSKSAQRWSSRIGGRHLGLFDTKEDAHEAYAKASREKFGEFARVR